MSGPAGIGAGISGAASLREIMNLRQQIIDRSTALKQVHELPPADPGAQSGTSFAGALQTALSSVNASQHKAEDIAAAYERGEVTDIAQVMLARQEASVGFEATLQVRNKLLSAYQDIMRMGV